MIETVSRVKRTQAEVEPSSIDSIDERMISKMRLILAWSALFIIYLDPSEPDRLIALTYTALTLYGLYSTALHVLTIRATWLLPKRILCWIDVAWYLTLVALSSGTSSIFFFFFFFAILVSSFRWGFAAGVQVTIVSALLFTVIGYLTAHPSSTFELNRFLLRPTYLLVLGYMMAYWGGREVTFKRRLALLKQVVGVSNPRLGIYHTIGLTMKKLHALYDADTCSIILPESGSDHYRLLQVVRNQAEGSVESEIIPAKLAELLIALPAEVALIHKGKRGSWSLRSSDNYSYDVVKRERTETTRGMGESLAARLDADSFISVPLLFHKKLSGRLYMTGPRALFETSDIEFLIQVFEQLAPILDNIKLIDQLSSNAAEHQRQRLALDIHDSVIQPYLGLHYKLAAIRNKIASNGGNVAEDIERLFKMTSSEVVDLRGFVRNLKGEGKYNEDLHSVVQRVTSQFIEHYGIDVRVEYLNRINIDGRLAAEVLQLIYEGLSNIRKHTRAAHSIIRLNCDDTTLNLEIENDCANGDDSSPSPFIPQSITERAKYLGGSARVEQSEDHRTRVKIEIPI
jgi:signal transduction histidine kinase